MWVEDEALPHGAVAVTRDTLALSELPYPPPPRLSASAQAAADAFKSRAAATLWPSLHLHLPSF